MNPHFKGELQNQVLADFPELALQIAVVTFKPGSVSNRTWEDPSRPMSPETYFRSHVPITGSFMVTMQFEDGPDEHFEVLQGRTWPHKEIRAGFRQVVYHPKEIEKGGEHFCIGPDNSEKYSLVYHLQDLAPGEKIEVEAGKLLLIHGPDYTINHTSKSDWSITACIHQGAVVNAKQACRVLIYQAVPHGKGNVLG